MKEIEQLAPFHFVRKGRKEVRLSDLCYKIKEGLGNGEDLLLLIKVMELVATHEVMDRAVFSEHYFIDLNKKEHSAAFR